MHEYIDPNGQNVWLYPFASAYQKEIAMHLSLMHLNCYILVNIYRIKVNSYSYTGKDTHTDSGQCESDWQSAEGPLHIRTNTEYTEWP